MYKARKGYHTIHRYTCSMRITHPDGTLKEMPFYSFEHNNGVKHMEMLAEKYAKQGIKLEFDNLTEYN